MTGRVKVGLGLLAILATGVVLPPAKPPGARVPARGEYLMRDHMEVRPAVYRGNLSLHETVVGCDSREVETAIGRMEILDCGSVMCAQERTDWRCIDLRPGSPSRHD